LLQGISQESSKQCDEATFMTIKGPTSKGAKAEDPILLSTLFAIVMCSVFADLVILPARIYWTGNETRVRVINAEVHPATNDPEGGPLPAYAMLRLDGFREDQFCADTSRARADSVDVIYSSRLDKLIVTPRGSSLATAIGNWDIQGFKTVPALFLFVP